MTASGAGVAMVVVGFVISMLLRSAQGSATVALVTTSAMLSPIVAEMEGVSAILVGLGICAGGVAISLPNDSAFWIVSRLCKFDVKQTMQVWTMGGVIACVTALVVVIILTLFSSALPGLL